MAAEYPRLLNLDRDTKERLLSYLNTEVGNHFNERGNFVADLEGWQKDYWAKPSTTKRTFPFYGASNIVVPLSAISVEAVHARAMTTLFAISPIVAVQMNTSRFPAGTDQALERWVDYELTHSMRVYWPFNDIVLETEKFGAGIGKSGYERVVKKAVKTIGEIEQEFDVVTRSTATIDSVPISRFLMPFSDQDPQTATWCGEEHSSSPYEVRQMEKSGLIYKETFDNIIAWVNNANSAVEAGSGQSFTEQQEELENKKPVFPKRIDWLELWLGFDVDGDEEDEEIHVLYHRESNYLMAVRYNWYDDLRRPYRIANYIPVEHRWSGLGICKQNEQFQREITTIHRQRLDNATIANMRMFKVHKLSGYGPKEPVFPGKMWFLDDMSHVETLQTGDVYQSSFANEQSALIYSQQRTGVNEVILGMPQVGTPGTATGDLARIQEGNKRFDFSFMNIKLTLSDLVLDAILNVKQFGTQNPEYFDVVEGGNLVRDVLAVPMPILRKELVFELGLAGQQENRMLDRQNWKDVYSILQTYYTSLIQLAQASGDPEIVQAIIKKGLSAATEAMRQLLESYNIRNIDRIIVSELEKLQNESVSRSQPALSAGRNTGLVGAGQAQGMDAISQVIAALGG